MAADRPNASVKQLGDITTMTSLVEACREGDLAAVVGIVSVIGIDALNESLPNGDTLIHVAAASGHVNIVQYLHTQGVTLDSSNQKAETPLHYAARYGHRDMVEALVAQQVDLDAHNLRGWTPLHTACYHRHEDTAALLLELGCKPDVPDLSNETPLHIACREDLPNVVKTLITYNCDVELENKAGMTPLMLAARFSDVEVVRSLVLAGADIDICTENGIMAFDIAVANGRKDVAELLEKLSSTITRDRRNVCVKQLMPTMRSLDCVRVYFFGASGVGKTQLIESLKVTVMQNLIRRGSALLSAVTGGGRGSASEKGERKSAPDKRTGRGTAAVKSKSNATERISMHQVPCHLKYTRGIDITQGNISGAGDLCFWEFSGYESYYTTYDTNLVGDPNAVYVIVVSLLHSPTERRRQINFWLDFIRCRVLPIEPVGFGGCKFWAPRVLLVATNAGNRYKPTPDERLEDDDDDRLAEELSKQFEADVVIEPHLFIVDSDEPMSFEMKTLRRAIAVIKNFICEYLPTEVGLLEPAISTFSDWCRVLSGFPVVTWTSFIEYIRSRVNLLATEDHLRELLNQLVVVGEVVDIKAADDELIVLDPQWLGSKVIGRLLAYDTVIHSQPTGLLRIADLLEHFPRIQSADVVRLLTALGLAVSCTTGKNTLTATTTPSREADLAVPCLDRSEGPPDDISVGYQASIASGSASGSGYEKTIIGGFSMNPELPAQLVHIFPRVVSFLLRSVLLSSSVNGGGVGGAEDGYNGSDNVDQSNGLVDTPKAPPFAFIGSHQIVQWSRGVRIIRDELLHAELELAEDGQSMTVVCWGPDDKRRDLFFFQETLCEIVFNAVENSCPAMYLERSPLSVHHLETAVRPPHAYRPREILLAQFAGASNVQAATVDKAELLVDLVAFGDSATFTHLRPGLDQPVSELPLYARYRLATLLDPAHPEGQDVNSLAKALGIPQPGQEKEKSDVDSSAELILSPTDALLAAWVSRSISMTDLQAVPTIRDLHGKLLGLERSDVVEALLSLTPVYRYVTY